MNMNEMISIFVFFNNNNNSMSNEEKKRIFFGAIQANKVTTQTTSEQQQQQDEDQQDDQQQQQPEFLPFSRFTKESQERHGKALEDFERKKRSKHVILPTDDALVKMKLRELSEPIILFGERPDERRARLKDICIDRNIANANPLAILKREGEEEKEEGEAFLTEGSQDLKLARLHIAEYSIKAASLRIKRAKLEKEKEAVVLAANKDILDPEKWQKTELEIEITEEKERYKQFTMASSEMGDERQLSVAVFSPLDSGVVATSSWSGVSKIWKLSDSSIECTNIMVDQPNPIAVFDSTIHTDSVNRVAFHPMGRHLATSCSDRSWRLFDIETKQTLLDQEGHGGAVFGIAFQQDGSLLASGATDQLVRLWDMRSGRPIHYFRGHAKQVISVDWSPNGYHVASSSEDNTVIVWDIRKKEKLHQILAHSSIVSCVKFQHSPNHSAASFLATSSFDNTVRLWSPIDFSPVSILQGHSSKVTSVDFSLDNSKLVSSSFDKTWKVWSK
ncbi:WD40 repeat-containing protein [Cavenderia fasciculata]|uniref:WD40 repeat-containing protein n=1 Tax=Cavenderia fasciculata TaxID=261658 RepID=F4PQZ4_CACFS|nr:WD40 repeat-containing protein [Cavenderia fasciculata]EGG21259.1 WD40 repeat-containing protein [Cavenderia fasciculata]|eukprot:XP_004359109.1 WD40 repeat-containing protein [Cavenderia fasciculata]